jgi:hypothetical protein
VTFFRIPDSVRDSVGKDRVSCGSPFPFSTIWFPEKPWLQTQCRLSSSAKPWLNRSMYNRTLIAARIGFACLVTLSDIIPILWNAHFERACDGPL